MATKEEVVFHVSDKNIQQEIKSFNELVSKYFPGCGIVNNWIDGVDNANYSVVYSNLQEGLNNYSLSVLPNDSKSFGQWIIRIDTPVSCDGLNEDDLATLVYHKGNRQFKFECTLNLFKTYKTKIRLIHHILISTMYGRKK